MNTITTLPVNIQPIGLCIQRIKQKIRVANYNYTMYLLEINIVNFAE